MYRTDYCGRLSGEDVGRRVRLAGWVKRRRDLGGLTFVDLRDSTGVVQLIFSGSDPRLSIGHDLNREDVITVAGKVRPRGRRM